VQAAAAAAADACIPQRSDAETLSWLDGILEMEEAE
jgi:hypothetical protein